MEEADWRERRQQQRAKRQAEIRQSICRARPIAKRGLVSLVELAQELLPRLADERYGGSLSELAPDALDELLDEATRIVVRDFRSSVLAGGRVRLIYDGQGDREGEEFAAANLEKVFQQKHDGSPILLMQHSLVRLREDLLQYVYMLIAAAEAWLQERGTVPSWRENAEPPSGKQPASKSKRGFKEEDQVLVREMRGLIATDQARNPHQAAKLVVGRAAGKGVETSKIQRLLKRYVEFPRDPDST